MDYVISAQEYVNGAPEPAPKLAKTIHVLVTPDRVDKIPMRYWEEVQGGTITGMIEMAAWFIADERGVFYTHDEAKDIIRDMPRKEALAMVERISTSIQEVSTPKK